MTALDNLPVQTIPVHCDGEEHYIINDHLKRIFIRYCDCKKCNNTLCKNNNDERKLICPDCLHKKDDKMTKDEFIATHTKHGNVHGVSRCPPHDLTLEYYCDNCSATFKD